jgi:hypothetical protein
MTLTKTITLIALCSLPALAFATPPDNEGPQVSRSLSPDHTELLKQVQEQWPEKYEKLMRLRVEDKEAFRHAMRRVSRYMSDPGKAEEVREEKASMMSLRQDFEEALLEYREASEKEKKTLYPELVEIAETIFDSRQEHRRQKLEKIRTHVEELQTEINDRDANREELIREVIEQKTNAKPKGL